MGSDNLAVKLTFKGLHAFCLKDSVWRHEAKEGRGFCVQYNLCRDSNGDTMDEPMIFMTKLEQAQ